MEVALLSSPAALTSPAIKLNASRAAVTPLSKLKRLLVLRIVDMAAVYAAATEAQKPQLVDLTQSELSAEWRWTLNG